MTRTWLFYVAARLNPAQRDRTEAGGGSSSRQCGNTSTGGVDGSDVDVVLHRGFPDTPTSPPTCCRIMDRLAVLSVLYTS